MHLVSLEAPNHVQCHESSASTLADQPPTPTHAHTSSPSFRYSSLSSTSWSDCVNPCGRVIKRMLLPLHHHSRPHTLPHTKSTSFPLGKFSSSFCACSCCEGACACGEQSQVTDAESSLACFNPSWLTSHPHPHMHTPPSFRHSSLSPTSWAEHVNPCGRVINQMLFPLHYHSRPHTTQKVPRLH